MNSAGGKEPDPRRDLPSVDELLRRTEVASWSEKWGREPVRARIREVLSRAREDLQSGAPAPTTERVLAEILRNLEHDRPSLQTVINGTGVVLHTNLGRAPLARGAARAAASVASSYSSLEYDLEAGTRGDRYSHCAGLIAELTGSEAALVVNNNAAAVSLTINTLARGRDVIVSRGELVEIGGGFRVPEVIERSGAYLKAVGTTNRTRIEDYRRAITPSTGLLLKVHPSNYQVSGFTEETELAELVQLGRSAGLPVMHDQGSGLLLPDLLPDTADPPVGTSVAAEADVITWSGDKLFGGPQAGLIHGRAAIVGELRANPMARAFRVDKMTLAALEWTLRAYRSPELAARSLPALRMIRESADSVRRRAEVALSALSAGAARAVEIVTLRSVLGGGSTPGFDIESAGWRMVEGADAAESFLRDFDPPVIGRVESGAFLLDFRTIGEDEQDEVARAVTAWIERAETSG
jgi:L-seryl-tRNA(Ser) seleniumtransferase